MQVELMGAGTWSAAFVIIIMPARLFFWGWGGGKKGLIFGAYRPKFHVWLCKLRGQMYSLSLGVWKGPHSSSLAVPAGAVAVVAFVGWVMLDICKVKSNVRVLLQLILGQELDGGCRAVWARTSPAANTPGIHLQGSVWPEVWVWQITQH